MSSGQLQIHSENILPIIKKWLYSERDIFLRELVSNACDASYKVKVLRERGEIQATDEELRVTVRIDKEARTLTFSDAGIGMTREEVEKYICQLAFSGAEEFIHKYESNKKEDQIIGHFGLGFFSAYMVADKVEIRTRSYQDSAEAVHWTCGGGTDYTIETGTRSERGTDVILHINSDSEEFLDAARLSEILNHYCSFLPFAIYLNEEHINRHDPLWMRPASGCSKEDYLAFYRYLYPGTDDPLFWIHINVDYPFNLQGVLFFPKLERQLDLRKHSVKLYCNRVFVSDNCRDLLPEYLTVLRGAIDSPDIPLNVSRSHLQMDRTVRQLSKHVAKKVADSLCQLYKEDPDHFLASWPDLSLIIKLGSVEDEKFFERVRSLLLWQTVEGEWKTVDQCLENSEGQTTIYYTTHEQHAEHLLQAYRDRGVDVLIADHSVDPYLINFLEQKIPNAKFQRIDAAVDEALLDTSREKNILDAEGKTEAGRIADCFRRKLAGEEIEVEAKSLSADYVPALIMMEEGTRRLRDYMQAVDPKQHSAHANILGKRTLVLNSNHPLVTAVLQLDSNDPDLASELSREIFDLALLSQRELQPDQLNAFIRRSHQVLERLAARSQVSGTSSPQDSHESQD